MIRLRLASEQRGDRGNEIIGHRAADAAVGKLDDRVFRAGRVRTTPDEIAVDPDIAEFVDDEREPPPAGVGHEMANQRRLARAEKAGDDGDGCFGEHAERILKPAQCQRTRAAACATRPPCEMREAARATERCPRGRRHSGAPQRRCPRDASRDQDRRRHRSICQARASATVHGRLQTERHSTALSAISGSPARRSPSASNRPGPIGPASDLQVTQTSSVAAADRAAVGVHGAVNPSRRSNGLGAKSEVCRAVMSAP